MILISVFKKNTNLGYVTLAGLMMALLFLTIPSAHAETVDVLKACNNQPTTVCASDGTDSTLFNVLENVINLLLMFIGIVAVITIIVAGIRYVTSGGDGQQTKSARDTILYALVGLVIALLAFPITNWVLNQLSK